MVWFVLDSCCMDGWGLYVDWYLWWVWIKRRDGRCSGHDFSLKPLNLCTMLVL